ncbi:hypothetical protein OIU77_003089 [Salix suchowensis]|uniref:anthocyanidin 3-O-glucosyltransferase n=1 Tax=Salix suchowensis TaxID=1278906 RepID=A0ABQ9B050_9ROSI|nr:hypothetical protein OIU77_003089 [Salix suchowensis]
MEKQNRMSHVLAIPIPAQGHINPMTQFSKRLASKELQVTIVIFSNKVLKHTRRLGSVQVVTIDFDGYEGKISLDDYLQQFRATVTRKLPELVAELSTSSGHPISCLLYDSHMPWVLETARQLGLIGASLFTQSCAVDTVYYNIQEMQQKKIPPEKLLVTFSRFPALAALEIADLPSFVQGMESESEYSSLLNQESSGKGVIVTWSQQLEVLAHRSVGCFMTHCGWNSTLEALSLGVPMVAMPQWTDQPTNAKYIADVWQVGVRVKANEKGIVTKEEVEGCIREVMEGERGNEIRRNSEKWMKLAQTAADEGGSSDKNITEFAAELARKFHHETWK